MRYGGRTDVRTHNKIVPPYTLVWGSLRLAPINGGMETKNQTVCLGLGMSLHTYPPGLMSVLSPGDLLR